MEPRLTVGALGRLRAGTDFRTLSYSGAGAGRGVARQVGLGCTRADFAAVRPGDVAVADDGGCFFHVKATNARRAGALALLAGSSSRAPGVTSATLGAPAGLPALILRRGLIGRIDDGAAVSLRVTAEVRPSTTWNVIAEAGRGRRVVMAGAHLDSVPAGAGIDDNGSGVAALLAVARALGPRPRARIRLGFWGAEELGLIGSRHYVRRLSAHERGVIDAYLNLDMVGSPNAVPAVYAGVDRRLTELLRRVHPGREPAAAASGGSDHAAFERAGISVAGLFTGADERGPGGRPRDPCYHRPCDTFDNVDREVLLRMARWAERALRALAT
jgi:Iap family predicted aminopeptidase